MLPRGERDSGDELPSLQQSAFSLIQLQLKMMNINGKRCKATVWDTAGQERFRTLTSSYYRGAHGIILVYDVTRPETLTGLGHWLGEIESYTPSGGADVVSQKLSLQQCTALRDCDETRQTLAAAPVL